MWGGGGNCTVEMRHVVRESLAGRKPRRISSGWHQYSPKVAWWSPHVAFTTVRCFFSLSFFFFFFAAGGTEKLLSPAFKRDRPVIAAQSFRVNISGQGGGGRNLPPPPPSPPSRYRITRMRVRTNRSLHAFKRVI